MMKMRNPSKMEVNIMLKLYVALRTSEEAEFLSIIAEVMLPQLVIMINRITVKS
jgi:hypothetical protein